MSQVYPERYRYQVCPSCRSKKIRPVAVVRLANNQWQVSISQVNRTGYMCDNCNRYHTNIQTKHITDRAEMRRDIIALQKFLAPNVTDDKGEVER